MKNVIIFKDKKCNLQRQVICMCVILDKIKNKTADELLQEYDINATPPINLSLLLKNIGITTIPFDFTEIEKKLNYQKGDISGIIYAQKDNLGIFYCATDSLNRTRFTIAHEIAHCCLHSESLKTRHIELRSEQNKNDPKEYNANIFAGELLIPKTSLIKIYEQFIIAPPLSTLSKIYEVSTAVMAARLDYLEMPYIKDFVEREN